MDEDFSGKQALVVGMARSGMAAAKFLLRHGARVIVSDLRPAQQLKPEIESLLAAGAAIETGGHRKRSFLDSDCIIVSPGVPADLPLLAEARAQRVPIWGEIELAARYLQGRLIAVTGSNGKTTTTSLIGHLLAALGEQVMVGGNIGAPLIDMVERSTPQSVSVAELSSFQLETTDAGFHPQVAVVLNLSPDHLDRHGSMENYIAAKQRIFLRQTDQDWAVLNAQDSVCQSFARVVASRVLWFDASGATLAAGAGLRDGQIYWRGPGEAKEVNLLRAEDIRLKGRHNLENVLAALAAVCALFPPAGAGADARREALRNGVASFRAVEHRLEFVARVRGVDYYNDSKATNVDATRKAIEAFPGGLWVILGGKDKESDYKPLAPLLLKRARGVLLIGAAAEKIASHLQPAGVPTQPAGNLVRALELAAAQARPGETVLLAPACASFDQFENYEARGRLFKSLVAQLLAAGPEPRAL